MLAKIVILACVLSSAALAEECDASHYLNVDSKCIERPVKSDHHLPGATAHCRDGSESFSQHHAGTCSHHGGVERWE